MVQYSKPWGMPSAGLLPPVWELKKANVAIRP